MAAATMRTTFARIGLSLEAATVVVVCRPKGVDDTQSSGRNSRATTDAPNYDINISLRTESKHEVDCLLDPVRAEDDSHDDAC